MCLRVSLHTHAEGTTDVYLACKALRCAVREDSIILVSDPCTTPHTPKIVSSLCSVAKLKSCKLVSHQKETNLQANDVR